MTRRLAIAAGLDCRSGKHGRDQKRTLSASASNVSVSEYKDPVATAKDTNTLGPQGVRRVSAESNGRHPCHYGREVDVGRPFKIRAHRCQAIAAKRYDFTLVALALAPLCAFAQRWCLPCTGERGVGMKSDYQHSPYKTVTVSLVSLLLVEAAILIITFLMIAAALMF